VFKIDPHYGPFTWAGLSALRTVSFLKIGYLGAIGIPIAAYILRSAQFFGISAYLPLTLFWMYIGSIALALGHLLNEIACPPLIKQFQTLHAFRAHLADSFAYQTTIHQAVKNNLKESIQNELWRDSKIPSQDHKTLSEIVADVLTEVETVTNPGQENKEEIAPEKEWVTSNECRLLLRFSIVALYAVSALIIGILSVRQAGIVMLATFGCFWQ
jgi:hypothetical protein